MDDLLLPGTIPGLLRRGSPCFVSWSHDREPVTISQIVGASGAEVTTVNNDPRKRKSYGYTQRSLYLDLTDATGRAHAAWWLAHRWPVGVAGKSTLLAGAMAAQHHQRAGRNVGVRFGPWATGEWLNWGSGLSDDRNVPALDDLNPDDDRRLPDGSRWVDAEALRRVCLHVARERGADV